MVLALIPTICGPIVKLALAVVAHVHVELPEIIVKINACVSVITSLSATVTGLLTPVIKLLN